MTKAELSSDIAKKTGIDKEQVVKTIEALMETIKSNMVKNDSIFLRGFGTFQNKKRAVKTARNISKNTTIIIPEHFVPSFKPCKEFVEQIKNKKGK